MKVRASMGALAARMTGLVGLWCGAVVASLLLAGTVPAAAQSSSPLTSFRAEPGAQMLVESDELVYDYDNNTVSAVGNVKIYYAGYSLEADKVTYNRGTGKLIATGTVKLTDPSGIEYYAVDVDMTDDFRDGFVQSLRVETPEQTRFAAERAERTGGEVTVFVNGVYTACEPCKEHPEKPPLWQIKAAKIIVNQKTKTVSFERASFELAGVPIAYLPYFKTADPSVKRQTGFLAPAFGYSEPLGWSITTPYFIALAPNYDVTVAPTYFSRQGLLVDAEWRHRLSNGQYTIRVAGISQNDPQAFLIDGSGTWSQEQQRGGIRTTGEFAINEWWSFGWDGTLSTDRTFTRNYNVLNNDNAFTKSDIHLTGLRDRSYFNASADYYQVLADKDLSNPANAQYSQGRQAVVTPVIDYVKYFDSPVLGGELALTSNFTLLDRQQADPFTVGPDPTTFYHGLAGTYMRTTVQLGWQNRIIGPLGQVITPFASLRGDLFSLDPNGPVWPQLTNNDVPTRVTPAVGVEWSWPVMATAGNSSHVIEPIAQVIVRPAEQYAGQLPNDDAQSLVFDDTLLFEHDKFSGFDRVEGGTRVNAGIRYSGSFSNGMVLEGVFGQSYSLSDNSFAVVDISDTGAFSGLESTVSDYVGRVSLDTGTGTRLTVRGRFDDQDFTLNSTVVEATKAVGPVTASATYLYAREIPEAGVATPTSQATAAASLNFVENWRLFGAAVYDFTGNMLIKDSVGIAYDDSCVSLSLAYTHTRDTDIPSQTLMLRVMLRTLAEGAVTANVSGLGTTSSN